MRTNRTTFPARTAALAVVIAVGATASCGSGDGDAADPPPPADTQVEEPPVADGAPESDGGDDATDAGRDAAAAMEGAVLRLEGVSFLEPELFVLDDPFEEYAASIEMYTLTIESLTDIRSEFPDAADVPPDGSETYTAVLEHLDAWTTLATSALAELEERRAELEPLTIDWAAAIDTGDPGPPPEEYADLVGRNPSAFEEFGQRCAEFAVSVDLAINCFGTPAPAADGSIEFTIGDVTLAVDPGPIDEYIVRPDFFGADIGPSDQMTISAPFPVRSPAAAIENDATEFPEGAPLEQPLPWPVDLDEYLATSPFEVIDEAIVSTPSGDFRRLALAQDEVPALSFVDLPPGPVVVRLTQPLILWIGEVDGQPVIATLQAGGQSVEELTAQVDEALATLRAVG